jgi:hypothetical protein
MSWSRLRRSVVTIALAWTLDGHAVAAELTFDLHIERGSVPANMRLVRVAQGDMVKLRWTADRATMLHLHGYDIEVTVNPGAVAEMSFTARATGRFPVSVHAPQAGGGHTHEPPLLHVEVRPPSGGLW